MKKGQMTAFGKTREEILQMEWTKERIDLFLRPRSLVSNALEGILRPLFQDSLNGAYLDVGTGTGFSLEFLTSSQLKETTCIDKSKELVEYLQTFFPEVSVVHGDVASMKNVFADGQFGCVGGINSIDTVPYESLCVAAEEIYRVLKPGGRFFHVLDQAPSRVAQSNAEIERFIQSFGIRDSGEMQSKYMEVLHNIFSKRLVSALETAGFKDAKGYTQENSYIGKQTESHMDVTCKRNVIIITDGTPKMLTYLPNWNVLVSRTGLIERKIDKNLPNKMVKEIVYARIVTATK